MESHTHYSPKVFLFGAVAIVGLLFVLSGARQPLYLQPASTGAYMDALNSTLGFHRVYATYNDSNDSLGSTNRTTGHRENLEAIAQLLGVNISFVKATTSEQAAVIQRQHGFLANVPKVAELDSHRRIYADMVANNVHSALILSSQVDVEIDLKTRLANAMGGAIAREYDILFLGQIYSDISETGARGVSAVLKQPLVSADSSFAQQRAWTKKEFLNRKTQAFRSMYPSGISHAYAITGRMARRLNRRLERRMTSDSSDLNYILADVAMAGIELAYSISPPPIALHSSEQLGGQYLSRSTLYAISLRTEDPSHYAPYNDWVDMWK
ncbi:hypothetical protein H4S07_002858 [Coemansia furcata]|uniref:Uncharacterized protein n=1 Tax=Coemansia furcata TaxID=417177 RepID=A0ACC1LIY0_9FUNG|nr:hypothetical protein H4S07_002858 [Coemansia furcata]